MPHTLSVIWRGKITSWHRTCSSTFEFLANVQNFGGSSSRSVHSIGIPLLSNTMLNSGLGGFGMCSFTRLHEPVIIPPSLVGPRISYNPILSKVAINDERLVSKPDFLHWKRRSHPRYSHSNTGNVVRTILSKKKDVSFAGYTMPHPMQYQVNIRVQTTGMA